MPSASLARLLEHLRTITDPNAILETARVVFQTALEEGTPRVGTEALLSSGQAHLKLGNLEAALGALREARAQAEALGVAEFELEALTGIAQVHRNLGEFDAAAQHLQRVLEFRLEGHERKVLLTVRAKALNIYAGVQHARGDATGALESLREALEVHRANRNDLDQAICLINTGVLYTDQGDYPHALESLLEARGLLRDRVDNPRQQGNCSINLGRVYEAMREYDNAVGMYAEALELARLNADRLTEAIASVNLGAAHERLERPQEALPLFECALEIARQIGLRQVEIAALDGIGTVRSAWGDLLAALEAHREALRLARETGYREQEIESLVNLARVQLASSHTELSLELLLEALPLAEGAELQKFVVDIHGLLAAVYETKRDFESALRHHRAYHRFERSMFNFEAERRTKHLKMTFELERARNETQIARRANELLEESVSLRTRELEEARIEVVMRLAVAAEYRDDTTGQHTSRVGVLAARIAERLELPLEEIELLRLAARLHDVGKIGISDLLMLKPAKLTPEEFERIKDHTIIGAQILSGGKSPLLQLAEVVALTHHERWDGHGYPHGLRGEDIPLPGRIVAVADVYDALLSGRPYKHAWQETEARAEIQAQSGTQFDPRVVRAFLEVLEEDDSK
jgi:HD-GYP domain-containing protein (c-di-GMP phosphodiesterase class II)